MRGILLSCALFTMVTVFAGAEAVGTGPVTAEPGQRQRLSLTVYNQGFGLVNDVREVDLPAGRFKLIWGAVPDQLDPDSVSLGPADEVDGPAILEQVFDEDLVGPARLLELFIGRDVTLVQEDLELREKRTRARLLSSSGPTLEVDGRVVVGHPGRIEFPELPDGLLLRPALGWFLESRTTGRRLLAAQYLTGGVGWSAGYRLDLNHEEDQGRLNGWVSVVNRSGADFAGAELRLVAGEVNRISGGARHDARAKSIPRAAMMDAEYDSAGGFGQEALSGYHLYTLERPAAILDNRTTRLAFAEAPAVAVTRQLVLRGNPSHNRSRHGEVQREPVTVVLRLKNSEGSGLGRPLPAGVWQVFKRDASGTDLFLGESHFGHTARGAEVVIETGRSFDVSAERVQTDHRKPGNVRWDVETAWRITLRNGSQRDEEVLVREPMQGQWELRGASHPHTRIDAATLGFQVPVGAGSSVTLEYRVAIDW